MSDDNTTEAQATDVDDDAVEAPAWTPPEGHTHLVDEAIRDAAATPIAWDESLPADGIVEHSAPGEFVDSMQYSVAGEDDADQGAEAAAAEPAPKAPAKKAPAKKAAGAKAAK